MLEGLADRLQEQQRRFENRRRQRRDGATGERRLRPGACDQRHPDLESELAMWRWAETRRNVVRADLRQSLAEVCELARAAAERFQSACAPRSPQLSGEVDPVVLAAAAEAEVGLKAARDRLAAAVSEGRELGLSEEELRPADSQRRKMHNLIQNMRGQIRVYCRIRPMSERERQLGETEALHAHNGTSVEVAGQNGSTFNFDAVFTPGTQEQVFEEARDLTQSALDGHNVSVLCYGQTGAGKTHTMYGTPDEDGLAVRMVQDLFERIGNRRVTVTGSLVELHNNRLVDLLAPNVEDHQQPAWATASPAVAFTGVAAAAASSMRPSLSLRRREADDEFHVEGLVEWPLRNIQELRNLVAAGTARRAVAAHALNSDSSRSHALLTIRVLSTVEGPSGTGFDSKITFCDLAGSERLKRTEATGEHAKEAIEINRSLSALGDVIEAIVKRHRHIPYRNHKLTQMLQDSLGGTAKALIFVNCSPASASAHESAMALKFAARATRVTNSSVVGTPRRHPASASGR